MNMVEEDIKNIISKKVENKDLSDDELESLIVKTLNDYSKTKSISLDDRIRIGKRIIYSMRKLDVLQDLLEDNDVSEIMINGINSVFVEKNGEIKSASVKFESEDKLKSIIQQIVTKCNRQVNESNPIVDARLADGSRVNVVLNPIAINGPIMTIRKFPKNPYTMEQLIKKQSLTEEVSSLLKKLVYAGYNIIVSGGTGSGKTTFLNVLSSFIPDDERIITIEDSAELQIQGIKNLVSMETRNSNVEGNNAISIRDLVKTSLRMRPDRIIVGEVRGAEAFDMICAAMNCGHDGSMSTVHSNNAYDTLGRLETMILMAVELPISAIRRQICSGVDIIIHLSRMRDKTRRVTEVAEIDRIEDGEIRLNYIYKFKEAEQSMKEVRGMLMKVGDIIHDDKIKSACLF